MRGSLRHYQVVTLGPDKSGQAPHILDSLKSRINELGDGIWDIVDVLEGAAASSFDRTAPTVALWFASTEPDDPAETAILEALLAEAKPVLPLVRDITNFTSVTPRQLHPINGLQLDNSEESLGRAVNAILEGLQLLRRRRRVFISYARNDSRAAGKQLFGSLAERGFDVFLDTHSVPAAVNFQNQLWHSMVDSDLIVLLDTNGVESSRWCREEYERADALSIGVVRVLWPDRKVNALTDSLLLSYPVRLLGEDFVSGSATPSSADELTEAAISRIGAAVEGFRARSIAARQANLVTNFKREAVRLGVAVAPQVNSHILVEKLKSDGSRKRIAVVATIGVPVSTNFHDAFLEYDTDPPDSDEQFVLYNRQGFLPSWVGHLTWLNGQLPVKGVDISEVPAWLSTL